MQPHEQRVHDEYSDLTEKRDKLIAFINTSPVFNRLPADEQCRLRRQHAVMCEYAKILAERILAFPTQPTAAG